MTTTTLGRLERVHLKEIWAHEATAFTPWLAREDNLALLGDALDIELELEAQEHPVGPFRADILCKDIERDAWVLIENQLQRTDHTHLGQLLTYAAGLQAVTIVWLAAEFTEDHRAALDWLNDITDETFRFFGVEVELWRIGDSAAAPKFNIVSKPNDWSRSVATAARAINQNELTPTRQLQLAYWTVFQEVLRATGGSVRSRKPQAFPWMGYSVGRAHMHLAPVMLITKRLVRAELYLTGAQAKSRFSALQKQQSEIEQEIGYRLEWEELPERQDCRIAVYLRDVDPADETDWLRQHTWLAEKLNDLRRVFGPRVKELDPDANFPAQKNGVANEG